MRKWSPNSKKVYDELDERLKVLVVRLRDETQNTLFENSFSKVRWPDSKHNRRPSKAIDLQPYPYPKMTSKVWGALGYIAGHAIRIAAEEGFSIRWGGDWDGDGDMTDQDFDDLFHFELT
jgi:peptidoglycan L-alanyl-D-glutamate endopeptidase CwlK